MTEEKLQSIIKVLLKALEEIKKSCSCGLNSRCKHCKIAEKAIRTAKDIGEKYD